MSLLVFYPSFCCLSSLHLPYVTVSGPCRLSEFYHKRSSPVGFSESNFRCTCPVPNVSHYYVANSLCSIN